MNLPNALTLTRIALVPVFVALYYIGFDGWDYYVAAVVLIASLTDWLDGYIARKYNLITDAGKLLDPIADKLLVAAALLVLMDCNRAPMWICLIIIGREFVISAFRLVAASKGVVIAAGSAGKLKTVTQMVAVLLLLVEGGLFGALTVSPGMVLLYISAVLAIYSCAEYIIKNIGLLKSVG